MENKMIKLNKKTLLRVGRQHLQALDVLKEQGRLGKVIFIVGSVMKNDSGPGKSYKYYDDLFAVFQKNGWQVIVKNNHSKILLFDTDKGKFVIETSSNLNENPNCEQFSFEKNEELYEFYKKYFLGGCCEWQIKKKCSKAYTVSLKNAVYLSPLLMTS